jgi:hypothetical protein
MNHFGDERNDAEVSAEDESRGQRVGDAALEDQVGVHQPVADDGPGERERQKHQRKAGQIGQQLWRIQVEQIGDGVEKREGKNRKQSATRNPLQLLAQQRRGGAAIAAQEEERCGNVEDGVVCRVDLVEPVKEELGGLARANGPEPQGKHSRAGRVDQGQQPAAAEILESLLRKAEREVQEERRLQRLGHNIRPEDDPVQSVEFGGVLQRVERKGNQAEEVKVRRAGGAPAAEKHVEADDEIDEADDAQAELETAIQRLGNDLDRRFEGNAIARDGVVDLAVRTGGVKCALQIGDHRNGRNGFSGGFADARQQVSHLDSGALPRLIGQNFFRVQAACSLAPPHAIVGLRKLALLEEIQHRQHEQRGRGQGQQRSLHAVEKACLHECGSSLLQAIYQHVGCHAGGMRLQARGLRPIV